MSTRSSLFLTNDNEHCYTDCNEPHLKDGKYIGNTITLEMNKKNIRVVADDDDNLIIEIIPGSELYDLIKMIRN